MNSKFAAILLSAVAAQTQVADDLTFGIGKGTLAVLIFAIFSIILCFFRDAFENPFCYSICICLLPLIVLLIIYAWPKVDTSIVEDVETIPTHIYLFRTVGFLVFVSLCCLFSTCMLLSNGISNVRGRRMDSEL